MGHDAFVMPCYQDPSMWHIPWSHLVNVVKLLLELNHHELGIPPACIHLEQKSWGHVSSFRGGASFHSAIDSSRESLHNDSGQRALVGSSQGKKRTIEKGESKMGSSLIHIEGFTSKLSITQLGIPTPSKFQWVFSTVTRTLQMTVKTAALLCLWLQSSWRI